jgi:uncharacterized coiled-coil DUF342 family protein
MAEQDQQLRTEFQAVKKELAQCRAKVSTVNKEKEEMFRQLRSIRDKIKVRSRKLKSLKEVRNTLTEEVKKLKSERDSLNSAVKSVTENVKSAPIREDYSKGYDKENDPRKMKRELEMLEQKIEVEVISFTKEQQFRKRIKELQKKLEKVSQQQEDTKQARVAHGQLSETRRKAQQSHKKVQEKASESQGKHEEMNILYDNIKTLREEEKPLVEKYIEHKKLFEDLKIQQDVLQKRVKELSDHFNTVTEQNFKAIAKEKSAEVKEKMKKGKKLRTEDILAWQAGE